MEEPPNLLSFGATMRHYRERLSASDEARTALQGLDRITLVDPREPEKGFRMKTDEERGWHMSQTDGMPVPDELTGDI